MNLPSYKAYKETISQKPVDYWQQLTQATVNEDWSNSSTVMVVQGQVVNGSKTFSNEELRVMSLIDPKTGNTFGDEYRKVIYKNFALRKNNRFLGKYYQFDDSVWIVVNTNTRVGATASAILQKCNNVLKWYDSNNKLHSWDCVFQRTLSSTNFDSGSKGVIEVSSDSMIKVQRNVETDSITINQRLIFDDHAFQVKQINNHISDSYMEIYITETQIQANDDIENDVANSPDDVVPESTNGIQIIPEVSRIIQGNEEDFSVYNYIDGEPNSDTFDVNTYGPVLGKDYTLTIIDGNHFTIANLKESKTPLVIVCTNKNDNSQKVITKLMLGGIW